MSKVLKVFIIGFLLIQFVSISGFAQKSSSEGYHDFKSLTKALQKLKSLNRGITKLESLGKTLLGKDIWMLQLSGEKGDPAEKPALLICANAEADHLIGSEVALGIAEYLTKGYKKDKKITNLLDKRTFYIIPRLNPDGAEMFFKKTLYQHEGNLRPRDDDYDWQIDEDGPEDLNGDGLITLMRVKDQKGEWYIDEKDPRLMKKKKSDTPLNTLYKLYLEGNDDDKDGFFNEDPKGGFNINRNFPHNFGYKPFGFGIHPASEIETRTLIDFVARYVPALKTQPHKNISAVLLFSKYDNLAAKAGIDCGKAEFPAPLRTLKRATSGFSFRRNRRNTKKAQKPFDPQPKSVNKKDMEIFKMVSKKYKDITQIQKSSSKKPSGSIFEWAYYQMGLPAFSANLWSPAQIMIKEPVKGKTKNAGVEKRAVKKPVPPSFRGSTGKNSSDGIDEQWLKGITKKNYQDGFRKWESFKHKQLGDVEIGGFSPYFRVNPPAKMINKLSKTHAEFALHLASLFAEIKMLKPEVKKLSSNLFELKIKIKNAGSFPYTTAMGKRTRNVAPILLRLKFGNKRMKLFGGSMRNDIISLEPGEEKELKWVIISPSGGEISVNLLARTGGGTLKSELVLK